MKFGERSVTMARKKGSGKNGSRKKPSRADHGRRPESGADSPGAARPDRLEEMRAKYLPHDAVNQSAASPEESPAAGESGGAAAGAVPEDTTVKDADEIIRVKKKGFRLARSAPRSSPLSESDSSVVARSPSLEELRAKYLPQDMLNEPAPARAASAAPSDEGLEMVEVEPDTDTGADPAGPGRKSVIISRKSGEIIGEQG
jgi:hypothetical protein